VVTSFVINVDRNGRMIVCLANALGGKNDKGAEIFLDLGPRRMPCFEKYILAIKINMVYQIPL
jgi:hypothetical protein